ncbi:MAG TPA: hypothetical protein PLZ64_03820 [Chitinophagales bacterium]|nr:hypothetical protein [Chitinophagales bacterium]
MKIITIAVPEDEMLVLDAFLQKTNIMVLNEREDQEETFSYEMEIEEPGTSTEDVLKVMGQIEKELEEEIWKLHHFAE